MKRTEPNQTSHESGLQIIPWQRAGMRSCRETSLTASMDEQLQGADVRFHCLLVADQWLHDPQPLRVTFTGRFQADVTLAIKRSRWRFRSTMARPRRPP